MKIVHLADIQIRFGSRHNEYRTVFKRLCDDLEKIKPDRIVIAGDINHHKINISPGSFDLCSELFIALAKIAPTDIILGNHDINLQNLDQGDSISPIFNLSHLIQNDADKIAYVVSDENKNKLDYSKKAIYYFADSGFYRIAKDLEYGVYSMKDNEIITLTKKEPGVNYIALFHGQIYGARGDNGRVLQGDNLVRLSTFNNFDIVMLGDIHEYQTFREDESMAYPGSLIQQNFGESIDKGYLLWDVEKRSHIRKFVPNDYGFAKLTIAKGEKFDERIEHIKFSNNKKKTKVNIVWEDYEENFSQEKENQISKLIKDKYGCEIVKVQFEAIPKAIYIDEEVTQEVYKESEQYLREFIEEGDYECSQEEIKELIDFHRDTNEKLEIDEEVLQGSSWFIEKIEISNIFSFPIKATTIDFAALYGIIGVFGENGNGKSNFIKAMIWGLYEEILGGGNPRFITNLYTDSNKGYIKIWLTIDGQKYFIERTVVTTTKKDGTTKNSYTIEYKKIQFEYDEEGNLDNEKWKDEESDEKTREKDEVKNLIIKSIGTFDDFTKTTLQTQGGKDDYLQMGQQPKNSLIAKYLNLSNYNLRYDFRNETFKDIKKKQKELGDKIDIEFKIKELEVTKVGKQKEYDNTVKEKEKANDSKERIEAIILELTRKLEKVDIVSINDEETINNYLGKYREDIKQITPEIKELEQWLSENFKRELPYDTSITIEQLMDSLGRGQKALKSDSDELDNLNKWISENPNKEEKDITKLESEIDCLKLSISQLESTVETYRGKKCPTCGTQHQKANPTKEEECLDDIKIKSELLAHKQKLVRENNEAKNHNVKVKTSLEKVELFKKSVVDKKDKLFALEEKIDLINKSKDIVSHNNIVEDKSKRLTSLKGKLDLSNREIQKLEDNLEKLIANKSKIEGNKIIQSEIDENTEMMKGYKLTVYNLDKLISQLFADIKVIENNVFNHSQKLVDIQEYEKLFRKYSLYLQAMHRDGIPSLIIRKKIPLINHRINTILQQVVSFKINMDVLANGDIVEAFYFSDDKSDMLPLSFASGAQKFVSLIAIKDALHYISNISKPSMCIIDEGFGTLDDKLTFEILNILNYLKNKHKTVVVISHRNEIKDFADNIIEVVKVTESIGKEILDKNPNAGVSKLNIL
jgi:DNA repair exonuclease SbcCD ATPase subunit